MGEWSNPANITNRLEAATVEAITFMGTDPAPLASAFYARYGIDVENLAEAAEAMLKKYMEDFLEDGDDVNDPDTWTALYMMGVLVGMTYARSN